LAHTRRLPVLCYGLRSDFRAQAFPGAAALLTLADDVEEMKTDVQRIGLLLFFSCFSSENFRSNRLLLRFFLTCQIILFAFLLFVF